jgi:hypothetical protein
MDGLIGIALFFLFYPIVVSIISSKLNKARYREVNEIVTRPNAAAGWSASS